MTACRILNGDSDTKHDGRLSSSSSSGTSSHPNLLLLGLVESSTLQNCKLHDFLLDFSCAKSRHLERMIRQMQVESSTLQNCKLHDFLLDFSCAKSRHLERMIRQMHFKHFGTKTQPGQKKEVAAVSSYIYIYTYVIYIYTNKITI